MKKFNIFVTRVIPDKGLKLLTTQPNYRVFISKKNGVLTNKELMAEIKKIVKTGGTCDALLTLLNDKIDGDVMDAASGTAATSAGLKIIANYAVGYDNILLNEAKKRGIIVTNTPGNEISDSVAEHAFALIIGLAKRLAEADKFTRQGKYHGWAPMLLLGTDLSGKTLGIIGAGRIGSTLARISHNGLKMKVIYTDISHNSTLENEVGAKFYKMPELLAKSDFVSLHVPLLESTRHLINAKTLKMMKKTAFLINTSRGQIVCEKDLLKALYAGHIAGAGLDVFECEPAIDCDLTDRMALNKLPNVILTPHTASATTETRQFMSELAAKNIIAVLSGRRPITPVAI